MLLVALVFMVVALTLVGVGLAVGLVACALGGFLLSVGVLSSSVLVGVCSGRAAWGVRAFVWQAGVLAGAPAGAVGAWMAQGLLASVDRATWAALAGGALGGAAGGLCVALTLDFCLRRLHRWAAATAGRALPGTTLAGRR